jgi:hypothetical protein
MDPVTTARILMGALVKGDEKLVESCMAFAKHMVEVAPQFDSDSAVFQHSLRCNMCFSFSIQAGTMMPLEKVWAASEEHGGTDQPWANNWSEIKN